MTTPFPFTSGATLTAQQLNDITNLPINDQTASYSAVVGDVGKRIVMDVATANTVTIDDAIFAVGDTIFIANKGAGASTVTAGAGVTIDTSGSLVLEQFGSGTLVALSASVFTFFSGGSGSGGLQLIITQVIGSAVASVAVTNAFNSTFDAYLITIAGGVGSTNSNLGLILGATTTGYFSGGFVVTYSSATLTALTNNNAASWTRSGTGTTGTLQMNVTLHDPFLTNPTKIQSQFASCNTVSEGGIISGFLNDTTSYTGFTITPSAGTLTGGTIRVYGYVNS